MSPISIEVANFHFIVSLAALSKQQLVSAIQNRTSVNVVIHSWAEEMTTMDAGGQHTVGIKGQTHLLRAPSLSAIQFISKGGGEKE